MAMVPRPLTHALRSLRLAAMMAVSLALVSSATPAGAVGADQVGVFPSWQVGGTSGAYTATPAFAPSAAFPAATLTSTSTVLIPQSGASAFLGPNTGFGREFGSSRLQPYLTFGAAAARANSTTTITFDAAPLTGWGFALGDVDAEWIFIQAFADGDRTIPLPLSDVGFRGAENYCAASPRPSGCTPPPFTDVPVWVTSPETFDGIDYAPGTLRGNSLPGAPAATRDTAGAYGWFTPSAAVRALTLTFGVRDGSPTSQLWIASPAPRLDVRGTVIAPAGSGVPGPPTLSVAVSDADGTPIPDYTGAPLTVPVDAATGAFEVELPQDADGYLAQVVVPEGFSSPAAVRISGVPSGADGTVVLDPITVVAVPTDPTTEPPVSDTPSTHGDADAASAARLAASGGSDAGVLILGAAGAVVAAAGILLRRRRT